MHIEKEMLFYIYYVCLYLQVHLSDDAGMEVLVQLLWWRAYQQVEEATAPKLETAPPSPRTSPPRVVPRVVVKGEARPPRCSNPFE